MKIAILGAGFAGLGLAWHLLRYSKGRVSLDFYDPAPLGMNASGISLGLLHAYAGKRANKAWNAQTLLYEAHRAISASSLALGQPVILSRGLMRPATSEQQVSDFLKRAQENPAELKWLSNEEAKEKEPQLELPQGCGALFIEEGLTLNVPLYLEGLWRACINLGALFHQTATISDEKLAHYDQVIVALGANSLALPALKELPITPIKGQILVSKWPTNFAPLSMSLAGGKQVVMHHENRTVAIGASYEREFTNLEPDIEKAKKEMLPEVHHFLPHVAQSEVIGCRVGIRACSADHLPLIGQVNEKMWFITGLGSKGLLFHAYTGKLLARCLLDKGDLNHVPFQLQWNLHHKKRPQA